MKDALRWAPCFPVARLSRSLEPDQEADLRDGGVVVARRLEAGVVHRLLDQPPRGPGAAAQPAA